MPALRASNKLGGGLEFILSLVETLRERIECYGDLCNINVIQNYENQTTLKGMESESHKIYP